jgi:hypothetical protein
MADDDAISDRYADLNCDDESLVKEIICSELCPAFDALPESSRAKAKDALSYYLTTNRINWLDTFNAELLPFKPPSDARQFFVWLWECVFKESNYQFNNPQGVIVIDDANAILNDYLK